MFDGRSRSTPYDWTRSEKYAQCYSSFTFQANKYVYCVLERMNRCSTLTAITRKYYAPVDFSSIVVNSPARISDSLVGDWEQDWSAYSALPIASTAAALLSMSTDLIRCTRLQWLNTSREGVRCGYSAVKRWTTPPLLNRNQSFSIVEFHKVYPTAYMWSWSL